MAGPSIVIHGALEAANEIASKFSESRDELKKKVDQVVDIVYRSARAKRPMGYFVGSGVSPKQVKGTKKKLKALGARRISDPSAAFGVPVRTGKLQQSIQKETHFSSMYQVTGKVWTDLVYASYVEDGTSRMAARPFMRPAYDLNKPLIDKIMGGSGQEGQKPSNNPNQGSGGSSSSSSSKSSGGNKTEAINEMGDAVEQAATDAGAGIVEDIGEALILGL